LARRRETRWVHGGAISNLRDEHLSNEPDDVLSGVVERSIRARRDPVIGDVMEPVVRRALRQRIRDPGDRRDEIETAGAAHRPRGDIVEPESVEDAGAAGAGLWIGVGGAAV